MNELNAVGEKATSALEYARTCCTIIEDVNIARETPAEKLTDFLRKMPRDGSHYLISSVETSSSATSHKKYHFVASQDKDLRLAISHTVAGIPLIYFNQGLRFSTTVL